MALIRGIRVIAEGIETRAELPMLRGSGVTLFQGFYCAKATFRSLAALPDSVYED